MTRPEAVELVRMIEGIDEVIAFDAEGLARLSTGSWDHVYSLSNDFTTASLATLAAPRHPAIGYSVIDGQLRPSNSTADHWLQMGCFDRLKRENARTYQDIMLDIIGEPGPVDPPNLRVADRLLAEASARVSALLASGRPRVGINIGSSGRWPKKMLDATQIAGFARIIQPTLEVDVLLLGGTAEAAKAEEILRLCGGHPAVKAELTGHSLPDFVATLAQVDALLCGDTLALHVAAALRVPTVCVFGPTSVAEIGDFNGLIVKHFTPKLNCLCCYGDCDKTANCMSLLDIEELAHLIAAQLAKSVRSKRKPSPDIKAVGAPATTGL
jgi:ADP-heptose:LPS heptosyltransferase